MSRPIIKKEQISTARLTLRPFREEDKARLVEMMQNPEITATFMVPDYKEEAQFCALADKLIAFSRIEDTVHLEYGIYQEDCLIGFINDCGHDDDAIEVGYVIDPSCKGQGYATEALKAVIGELREMGFKKVLAGFFEGNIGSFRVMEKCGLRLNGRIYEEEYRGKMRKCYECEMPLSGGYLLRKADANDAARINELFIEMLQTVYHTADVKGYEAGYTDRYFANGEDWICVAEKDAEIVAFLSIEVQRENGCLYLNDFSVTENCRGAGIGTQLLGKAEAYAHKIGVPGIALHMEKSNINAHRLYHRSGYRDVKDEGSRVLMMKKISI